MHDTVSQEMSELVIKEDVQTVLLAECILWACVSYSLHNHNEFTFFTLACTKCAFGMKLVWKYMDHLGSVVHIYVPVYIQ